MSLFAKLTEKPWLNPGALEELPDPSVAAAETKKTGLMILLGVISSLFFLFIMAYRQRGVLPDWQPVVVPTILWFNTVLLVFGSLAMQYARSSADQGQMAGVRLGLLMGGLLTLAFLGGQFLGWQQMNAAGLYLSANPANAFFFLLTGAHGLHLVGGLLVWSWNTVRVWRGFGEDDSDQANQVRLSVELCTTYWHYLLLVWLILLGLLLVT